MASTCPVRGSSPRTHIFPLFPMEAWVMSTLIPDEGREANRLALLHWLDVHCRWHQRYPKHGKSCSFRITSSAFLSVGTPWNIVAYKAQGLSDSDASDFALWATVERVLAVCSTTLVLLVHQSNSPKDGPTTLVKPREGPLHQKQRTKQQTRLPCLVVCFIGRQLSVDTIQ